MTLSNVESDEGTNMNYSQPSCVYDKLESVEELHPPGIYDQVGAVKQLKNNYDLYDKLPRGRKVR